MKKRIVIVLISLVIILGVTSIILINSDNKGFYTLKDDNIRNITKVVGNRKLFKKTKTKNGNTIIKTYEYKDIQDPYSDLSDYISYLEEKSNFVPTKDFNLENKIGEIELSRYSTNKEYIILININYSADSYTIKITRGKGKLESLNNS